MVRVVKLEKDEDEYRAYLTAFVEKEGTGGNTSGWASRKRTRSLGVDEDVVRLWCVVLVWGKNTRSYQREEGEIV